MSIVSDGRAILTRQVSWVFSGITVDEQTNKYGFNGRIREEWPKNGVKVALNYPQATKIHKSRAFQCFSSSFVSGGKNKNSNEAIFVEMSFFAFNILF